MIFFVYLLLFLTVIGLIGSTIFYLIKNKFNFSFLGSMFLVLLSGYILTISFFSLYYTKLLSVNATYLLVGIFGSIVIWRVPKKKTRIELKLGRKEVLFLLFSLFFFFCLCFFTIENGEGYLKFHYNLRDYILYARVAKYLPITGQENGFNSLNLLDSYYHGPEPYHYFDLWGAAFASKLLGINEYLSLYLIVYPFFYFLVYLSIILCFQKVDLKKMTLAFIVIWFGGLYLNIYQEIPLLKNLNNIGFNLLQISAYKLIYFYIFIVCSYLLYSKKFYLLSLLSLLCLVTANIIAAPVVIPTILFMLIILYKTRRIDRTTLFEIGTYLLIYIVSLIVLYSFFKSDRAGLAGAEITSPISLLKDNFSADGLTTQRNILISGILYLIILYIPLLYFMLKVKGPRLFKNPIFLFVFSSILFSILAWAVLFTELNSSQIYYNWSIPLMNIVGILIIINVLDQQIEKRTFKTTTIVSFSVISLLMITSSTYKTLSGISYHKKQYHSNAYLSELGSSIQRNSFVASIKSPREMIEMHAKYNAVSPLGNYLILLEKNINAINVSDLDTPIDTTSNLNYRRSIKAVRDGLFYRFAQFPENKSLNRDDLIVKFLEVYQIKQLIASKDAIIPQLLLENSKKEIVDSVSGERYLLINEELFNN